MCFYKCASRAWNSTQDIKFSVTLCTLQDKPSVIDTVGCYVLSKVHAPIHAKLPPFSVPVFQPQIFNYWDEPEWTPYKRYSIVQDILCVYMVRQPLPRRVTQGPWQCHDRGSYRETRLNATGLRDYDWVTRLWLAPILPVFVICLHLLRVLSSSDSPHNRPCITLVVMHRTLWPMERQLGKFSSLI